MPGQKGRSRVSAARKRRIGVLGGHFGVFRRILQLEHRRLEAMAFVVGQHSEFLPLDALQWLFGAVDVLHEEAETVQVETVVDSVLNNVSHQINTCLLSL